MIRGIRESAAETIPRELWRFGCVPALTGQGRREGRDLLGQVMGFIIGAARKPGKSQGTNGASTAAISNMTPTAIENVPP